MNFFADAGRITINMGAIHTARITIKFVTCLWSTDYWSHWWDAKNGHLLWTADYVISNQGCEYKSTTSHPPGAWILEYYGSSSGWRVGTGMQLESMRCIVPADACWGGGYTQLDLAQPIDCKPALSVCLSRNSHVDRLSSSLQSI